MKAHFITARNSQVLSKLPLSHPSRNRDLGREGRAGESSKVGSEEDLDAESEFRGWSESNDLSSISLSKQGGGWGKRKHCLDYENPETPQSREEGAALKGASSISLSQRTCWVRGVISPWGYRGEKEYLC